MNITLPGQREYPLSIDRKESACASLAHVWTCLFATHAHDALYLVPLDLEVEDDT